MPSIVEPPRHWQDWTTWGLGLWLIVSPWLLGFTLDGRAIAVAAVTGFLLLAVEAVALSAFSAWEEWVNAALGVWLILAGFLLGIRETAAVAEFVVIGIIVIALALNELREARRLSSAGL